MINANHGGVHVDYWVGVHIKPGGLHRLKALALRRWQEVVEPVKLFRYQTALEDIMICRIAKRCTKILYHSICVASAN